jgi:outer membrane receptor for ferrienterochelin and colicins
MYLIKYLVFILLISFSFSTVLITGNVKDERGQSIANANILFLDTGLGASTDEDGYFSIELNSSQITSCKLEVSHIGYQKFEETFDCDENQYLSLTMIRSAVNFNEVVVTGNRQQTYIKDSPVLTHVINSDEINNSGYTSVKDVLAMSLPNFQSSMWTHANFTSDRVKIQGLNDKYILFLVDGARVSGEFSGMLDFSMLDISNVERVEFVEGGMSSLYGSSAIGGVVNIITKKNRKKFTSKLSYTYDDPMVITKNFNLGIRFKSLSYILNLNQNKSDGYDLTRQDAVYSGQGGAYTKTLEKYKSLSHDHKLSFSYNNKFFIDMNFKNYIKDIFVFQDYQVPIDSEPFFDYYTAFQHEMPKSEDNRFGLVFKINNKGSLFRVSYNKEEYTKSYHYFNYSSIYNNIDYNFYNNSDQLVEKDIVNAIHINESINVQYDKVISNHEVGVGIEVNNDSYSSFNIYKESGDRYEDGYEKNVCDFPNNYTLTDCEASSIFGGVDKSKYFSRGAVYLGDQWTLDSSDKINIAIRHVVSRSYQNSTVLSAAYMLKKYQPYDVRLNYSRGFRNPSVKELYYNFLGHSPIIVGNPKLVPTFNDYIAFSIDKRVFNNSYSFEFFYNNIRDMIGTQNQGDELRYVNYNSVKIFGANCHYERLLSPNHKLKAILNYTDPRSPNISALELMSKYSIRLNYLYSIYKDKVRLSFNVKYVDRKFILEGVKKTWLDAYTMTDLLLIFSGDAIEFKVGLKNLSDYKDERRFSNTESLSSYDPGRRFIFQFSLKY